ncbi:MAG: hypothetical protein IT372_27290 [Polyangiaceae bacterium]|nr:hypothetical protein [Polyangiaceae bacterium]
MSEVLERGDIYFLYRPKVEREVGEVEGMEDVQRLYVVLHPEGERRYRLIVIGQKRMPELGGPEDRTRRNWGFVEKVAEDAKVMRQELAQRTYETKTRGERVLPEARPAGEGVYAIVAHGDGGARRHTHLAYALELPREPGEVQEELGLADEGSYVVSVKNPEAPSPPSAGLRRGQRAELPRDLQERFGGRRFVDVDPPAFLDHEGTEIVLVGAREDASEELGIDLEPEEESRETADVCRDLRLECSRRRVEPLLEGRWA